MPIQPSRREFLSTTLLAGACLGLAPHGRAADEPAQRGARMGFGLVTYLWGQHWTLDELIPNCEKAGVRGVELRTTHKHGVEPALNEQQRADVAKRFADSSVTLVGLGSNERFDHPDPAELNKAIEASKAFLRLSHDIGSSGVKVKPDRFWPDVPREKTIEQIGTALQQLGEYAEGFGQQVRLEVHGQCAELPTIKAIMDIATHPSVAVCWNSNPDDLKGAGLKHNFELVAPRFGATCHIHELERSDYPFAELFHLLVGIDYDGWLLLEASSQPADPVAALITQRQLFEKLLAAARG